MENIKETTVTTEQVEDNSQDDAIASAKQRVKNSYEKKIANEYVPLEDYNKLQAKYNELDAQIKLPGIKQQLVDAGMKQDAVNDFIKLHPEIMKGDKDAIAKLVDETKKTNSYMFDSKPFNASALPPNVPMNKETSKPQYELDSNGFLIRNNK